MRRTKHAGRVDANQTAIVAALRQVGCSVLSLATLGRGCPDILIGVSGRNLLAEIKDGMRVPSERKLSELEAKFHKEWGGQVTVLNSVEDALRLVAG